MNRKTIQRWGQGLFGARRIASWPAFYPAVLLLIGLLTYLYALPSLGYFWDDWEVVFLLDSGNPRLLADYFAFDRPFAWPYTLMYGVFGLHAAAWHVVTLLLRWGGILLIYFALKEVWPTQRWYLQWVGVLLLVYPGYLQQSISGAYNRHFMAFFIFAVSIYLMVLATRRVRSSWLLELLAWAATLVHIFTIEYFVGLELARPLLLWLLMTRRYGLSGRRALGAVVRRAVPYVLILVLYFWWRLVVFPNTIPMANYTGDFKFLQDFDVSYLSGLLVLATRAILDFVYGAFQVWLSLVGDAEAWTLAGKISWFALVLASVLAMTFAFLQERRTQAQGSAPALPRSLICFGSWAWLASALPIWLTSKQLSGAGRWDDRFALAPMLGICIVVVWLIGTVIRRRLQTVALTLLLATAIATQVLVANRYRLDWIVQNEYYWQLAWRIPALRPGTAIISFEQPSPSMPGYDASFAMNLLFRGRAADGDVPYWFFTNDRFLNFELRPEKPIRYRDRNLKFTGNTSEAIAVIHQGERRCLQVLDSAYAQQPFYGQNQEQLVALSNTSRILATTDVPRPDTSIFGSEPSHDWCYYFQKADLARQLGDWEAVLALEEEAASKGVEAGFGPELLPFIEAHARQGDWSQALDLSRKAQGIVAEMDPFLCDNWARLSFLPGAELDVVYSAREAFACESS